MIEFAQRMEKIRQVSVEKAMSVNIDMRAYKAIWAVGVGGVQVCQSNSFVEVIEAIERQLGIAPELSPTALKELELARSEHRASQWQFIKKRAENYATRAEFWFDEDNELTIVIKSMIGTIVNKFKGETEEETLNLAEAHFKR